MSLQFIDFYCSHLSIFLLEDLLRKENAVPTRAQRPQPPVSIGSASFYIILKCLCFQPALPNDRRRAMSPAIAPPSASSNRVPIKPKQAPLSAASVRKSCD